MTGRTICQMLLWLKKAMPDVDLDKFRTSLLSLKDTVKGKVGEVEMDPALKAAGWDKYQEFRGWFDKRLDSAIQAAIEEGRQEDEEEERSSKAEDIEEFSIQQNEEVKTKATEEKAKEVVKDLQKTLQAPLTALSVTAVDGGKEQEGLIDREKQRTEAERQKNVTLARKLE